MNKMMIVAVGLALGLIGAGCATTGGGSATSQANVPNANISGTWTGEFAGRGMNRPLVLTLEQVGSDVTGNLSGAGGDYGGRIRGVVKGNEFSFRSVGGSGGGELVVNGNEMTGTGRSHYGDGRMTFRRSQ